MDRLLRQQLEAIARDRRSGAAQLALRAVTDLQSWLRRHPKPTEQELLDIASALLRAQPSMAPLLRLANELALAGIWVCLKTDAALFSMAPFGHLVLGADKILRNGFENKIGTDVLVERAHRGAIKGHMRKMRFWVLADTTKFWPESVNAMSPFWKLIQGPHAEVWKEAPKGLWVSNNYFCGVRFFSPMRILTERGWMTPKRSEERR